MKMALSDVELNLAKDMGQHGLEEKALSLYGRARLTLLEHSKCFGELSNEKQLVFAHSPI